MKDVFAELRTDYPTRPMLEESLDPDPFKQFQTWFNEARQSESSEANAMVLSTATAGGRPSARVVLLKELDTQGFIFFTNYRSRKASELKQNQHGSLLFHWPSRNRQVRVEGLIEAIAVEASDAYFASRPRDAQLGAWASHQSTQVGSRAELESRMREMSERFTQTSVPRPPFWGGYCLVPGLLEFWQGQPNRLHDRLVYRRHGDEWDISRLMP